MATRIVDTVPVDILDGAFRLPEASPASTNLLASIDERQLRAMTSAGNPPHVRSCYLRATASTTWTFGYRRPPGCEWVDFGFLAWGTGTITLTSTLDATGTMLDVRNLGNVESARWLYTAGIIDSAAGAGSGRALKVRSAIGWTYSATTLTLTIDDVTDECGVAAIATIPIWQPITV